jgi:hypothetical protein
MVGPNKAFLVSDNLHVMTGLVEPQTIPSGGFMNASVLGDYFLGTIDRASAQVIDASGVENLDGVNTWASNGRCQLAKWHLWRCLGDRTL